MQCWPDSAKRASETCRDNFARMHAHAPTHIDVDDQTAPSNVAQSLKKRAMQANQPQVDISHGKEKD